MTKSEVAPNVQYVVDSTLYKYQMTKEELFSDRRFRRYALARKEIAKTLYESGWFSVQEIAEILHLSRATVLYHNGRIRR